METVEGQTPRVGVNIDFHEGKLDVYQITKAKMKLFRDCGTMAGRNNDLAYAFLTFGVSTLVACITTNIESTIKLLVFLTIVFLAVSVILFIKSYKKKKELHALYEDVIAGNM